MGDKRSCLVFEILFVFLFCILLVSPLSVMPAKKEVNFEPNLVKEFAYKVEEGNPNADLEVYVSGDLGDYVSFDKNILKNGEGFFIVTLKLPAIIEKPGKYRILIGVREKVDDELREGTIGTAVIIKVPIDVYVPYPGRYLEATLVSNNVNVGESVNFDLNIINRGKEDVEVIPKIEIYSEKNLVETLVLKERFLKSQESIELRKSLDTVDYVYGLYNAMAILDYGEVSKLETDFRIGDLIVDISNYTKRISLGGLQKFEIEVENQWNSGIRDIYADVSIYSGETLVVEFKTSPESLEPWEKKRISGFFETENIVGGVYEANISLNYGGKVSGEVVSVEFVKKSNILIYVIVVGAIILVLIVFFFVKKKFFKNAKK